MVNDVFSAEFQESIKNSLSLRYREDIERLGISGGALLRGRAIARTKRQDGSGATRGTLETSRNLDIRTRLNRLGLSYQIGIRQNRNINYINRGLLALRDKINPTFKSANPSSSSYDSDFAFWLNSSAVRTELQSIILNRGRNQTSLYDIALQTGIRVGGANSSVSLSSPPIEPVFETVREFIRLIGINTSLSQN